MIYSSIFSISHIEFVLRLLSPYSRQKDITQFVLYTSVLSMNESVWSPQGNFDSFLCRINQWSLFAIIFVREQRITLVMNRYDQWKKALSSSFGGSNAKSVLFVEFTASHKSLHFITCLKPYLQIAFLKLAHRKVVITMFLS